MYQSITLKQAPEVKRLIVAAFPSYRKLRGTVATFHAINVNSYWDGGSKDEYAIVDIVSGQRVAVPTAGHPYFDTAARGIANIGNGAIEVDRVGNVVLKLLPRGMALVRCGVFCGKPATACVYVNAEDLTPTLTAGSAL